LWAAKQEEEKEKERDGCDGSHLHRILEAEITQGIPGGSVDVKLQEVVLDASRSIFVTIWVRTWGDQLKVC
jgi:hypothetical protein